MRSLAFLPAVVLAAFALAACGSPDATGTRASKQKEDTSEEKEDSKKDSESSESSSSASSSKSDSSSTGSDDRAPASGETPAPAAPAFPRAAKETECTGGNGLYCNGHGVEGAAGTLYRCTDGQIKEEKKCATACIYLGTGNADACDGDGTKCPRGDGLYCGTNYFSGDEKALLRCKKGVVTVEKACTTSCVKEADGTPDRCE